MRKPLKLLHKIFNKPPFMLHWRLLLPRRKGIQATHQAVLLNAWRQSPFYLHAPLLLMQCLYWYGFKAWKLSIKTSYKRDFTVKKHHDLTRLQCLFHLLYFTLGYNLTPRDVFFYKLYNNPTSVLDRLYSFEGPIVHELNNRAFDNVKKAKHLLGDKLAFAQALQSIGMPCITTAVFSPQQHHQIIELQANQHYFIKPNTANCSTDAAALVYNNKHYALQLIQGEHINQPDKIKKQLQCWAQSQRFIIQPLLLNHAELREQFTSDDLITFRLITIKSPHGAAMPVYLKIEIALAEKAKNHQQFYQVYAIDLQSYCLSSTNPHTPAESPRPQLSSVIIKQIQQAIGYCTTTHDQLFDCYAVGFDFCITPDGPVIIEGNYGWDVSTVEYQALSPCNL
ncbi:MAG: sugar-transfer associated ATP-grasp domain-containing protein [Coxiellaceae bacterium]|nr:sugar-transfer associated ATP-grasp domain-containing protein [Coxiellaceae bacterium]